MKGLQDRRVGHGHRSKRQVVKKVEPSTRYDHVTNIKETLDSDYPME